MAYVPSERICFDSNAVLEFHAAAYANDKRERNLEITKWMFDQYPQDIREWFKARDVTPEEMQVFYVWRIYAADLWAMGYRKCEPEPEPPEIKPVPMTKLKDGSQVKSGDFPPLSKEPWCSDPDQNPTLYFRCSEKPKS